MQRMLIGAQRRLRERSLSEAKISLAEKKVGKPEV